ncbi:MAG: hypothetical protein WKF96_08110 [Solirubrobacteraceae bacterium]
MPDRRSSSDKVGWKAYVDKVFEEHRVQVEAALAAHDQRVMMNHEAASERLTSLHNHVERILDEKQRATDIAEREREKASMALRDEQRVARDTAEREREKAAQALAAGLARAIQEGDDRLREHIENQVQQINAALEAARRETGIIHTASEKAIEKAEVSTDKRFFASNETRSQMADQIGSHRENLEKIVRELMPREVAEAKLDEMRQQIHVLSEKLGKLV